VRLRPVALVVTFALGLLAGPLPAEAQKAGKVYRIGFLDFRLRSTTTDPRFIALRQGLRELGYVEGQNLVLEYRFAKGKRKRIPEIAAELVRLKVDVIVTSPQPFVIRATQRAIRTIPIVIPEIHIDPVEAGFVVSLARPGGNITGLTNLELELHPKRLELLKEAFPRISRMAILWPPPQQKRAMKEIEAGGQALGIQIQSVVYNRSLGCQIECVLSAISQERPDALLVASTGFTRTHRARIIEFTAKRRLPTIYGSNIFVKAGGLMFYGVNVPDLFRLIRMAIDPEDTDKI